MRDADQESSADLENAITGFLDWAEECGVDPPPTLLRKPPEGDVQDAASSLPSTYELLGVLGEGGMGIVYEAVQSSVSGRRVAIKILKGESLAGAHQLERFRREIFTIGKLDHPCIVPILDAGATGRQPFFAMKFIPGMSLKSLLIALRRQPEAPSRTRAVRAIVGEPDSTGSATNNWEESYSRWVARVGLQLAEALQHAHERDIVHRDVKPGNVMITPAGVPVLLDFGLASHGEMATLTRTGDFLGTIGYASPEQLAGEEVDARSDVYSLGAVLYELLVLRRPFESVSGTALTTELVRQEARPLGRGIERDLRTIVGRALATRVNKRYSSARALARDLRAFLNGETIEARPPGIADRGVQWVRRNPLLSVAAAVALVMIAGFQGRAYSRAKARVDAGERLSLALEDERARLEPVVERYRLQLETPGEDPLRVLATRAEIEGARSRLELGVAEARATLEQAFESVAGHAGARRALADLHADDLRHGLGQYEDLLDSEGLALTERELQRYDDESRYADLLIDRGWVQLEADAEGAEYRVWRSGEESILKRGRTPAQMDLPAGSYIAELTAPGRHSTLYPFLVRRSACYEAEGARPSRELFVEMMPEDRVPPGFLPIPGGETWVAADPPTWVRVPSFVIKEFEVSIREWVRYANESERLSGTRFGVTPHASIRRGDHRRWELGNSGIGNSGLGDLPVHGSTPMRMAHWASRFVYAFQPTPENWYSDLPTSAEWIRAARGADARRYPWGDHYDVSSSANFLSGPAAFGHAKVMEVGAFPRDVSPFGVRDLAGSVSEQTRDLHRPRAGEYCVRGGSFMSAEPGELAVDNLRANLNETPLEEVGFRPVLRPLPQRALPSSDVPKSFRDDFDRPDSDTVGGRWFEEIGQPLQLTSNGNYSEECFIESSRLVVCGARGHFSDGSVAWHPLALPSESVTVRTSIDFCHSMPPGANVPRGCGVRLSEGFTPQANDTLVLMNQISGGLTLLVDLLPEESSMDEIPDLDMSLGWIQEIHLTRTSCEARVWLPGEARPAEPTLRAWRSENLAWPRFVGITAPNYVGARIEVDWIEVDVR